MAEIFETFLLIATFNIALIATTIGNYAISASYLGRETRLTRSRMEKRKEKLKLKLADLQKESLQIENMKQEIKQAEKDISRLNNRIFLLSWLGAVISPTFFFTLSLITAVLGMNLEILTTNLQTRNLWEQQFMIFSSGTLVVGFFLLLIVIGVIDSAARKIPAPEFEIFFGDKTKTAKLKRNAKAEILVCIKNKGEDAAEDVDVYIHFPPFFEIQENPIYSVQKQLDVGVDFPNYNSVVICFDFLHADIISGGNVLILPKESGTFEIPVRIYERKLGVTKANLTIEVID